MATKEELQWLQNLANQYGWADSQQFKDYVNQTDWTWSYDTLLDWLKNQASVQTAPAPTSNVWKIDTRTWQEVQAWFKRPWNSDLINPALNSGQLNTEKWVQDFLNTSNPNASKPPIWTINIGEAPKIETPKVEAPKPQVNALWTPKWQEDIDKALQTQQPAQLKAIIDQNKANFTPEEYEQVNAYLSSKALWTEVKIDENSVFQWIRTWTLDKSLIWTTEYNNALARSTNLSRFESMNARDLSYAMQQWQILPWTQLYNDLKAVNPQAVKEAEALNSLNSVFSKKSSVEDFLTNISSQILQGFNWDVWNYKAVLSQNPRVTELNSTMTETKKEIDSLKDSIDNAYRDLEKQLSWTWATKWYIQAKASRMSEDLIRQYNAKLSEYKTYASELSIITENVKYEMQLAEKQEAKKMQALEFAYSMWKDELNYQRTLDNRAYEEQLAQKQLEQKFAYEYWDINSTDPNIQRVAFERIAEDLQKQYTWMPFRRTVSEMAMDFMNEFNNGKSLSDISKETTQAIQGSPAYNQWAMNKGLIAKPTSSNFDIKEVWGVTYKINNDTWDYEIVTWWTTPQVTDYYNNFRVTQNAWDKSPNSKDTWYNWWTPWIDFAMPEWTDVIAFTWWQVVKAWSSWDYWTQVIVEDSQGNQHMYSHLQDWLVNVWDTIQPWQTIAKSWNTWFSTWPHLDYRVKWADWKWQDPNNYIKWEVKIWDTDIRVFNWLTPSERSKKQTDPQYQEFVRLQNEIFINENANLEDILKFSAWWDNPWETASNQLIKFNQALTQVADLQKNIKDMKTWPIIWTLRQYNPYDSNAQALKAQLNSLVPNIARWVYWEVWVLTDADIELYKKTLPNIQSTDDTNKLVLAMTLNTMLNWYKGQLQTLAWTWRDVSRLQGKYKEYESTINWLLNSINGNTNQTQTIQTNQWDYSEEDLLNSLK